MKTLHSFLTKVAPIAALLGLLTACGEEKKAEAQPAFADTKGKAAPKENTDSGKSERPPRDRGDRPEGDRGDRRRGGFSFADRDVDGDGALSREEMGDMGWLMMRRGDTDGDGKLTEVEMQEFRESGGFRRPEPSEMVEVLDKDGDGQLNVDEMPEFMRDRFSESDTDGDGKITIAEMEARAAAREAERSLSGDEGRGFGRGPGGFGPGGGGRRPGGDGGGGEDPGANDL